MGDSYQEVSLKPLVVVESKRMPNCQTLSLLKAWSVYFHRLWKRAYYFRPNSFLFSWRRNGDPIASIHSMNCKRSGISSWLEKLIVGFKQSSQQLPVSLWQESTVALLTLPSHPSLELTISWCSISYRRLYSFLFPLASKVYRFPAKSTAKPAFWTKFISSNDSCAAGKTIAHVVTSCQLPLGTVFISSI